MIFKYMDFVKIDTKCGGDYQILTKHRDLLGVLLLVPDSGNNQWVFPEKNTIFSAGCLTDLGDFMTGNEWNGRVVFRDEKPLPRTLRWTLHTTKKIEDPSDWHGEIVGEVKYYANWRQYCFFSYAKKLNRGDVRDITLFIKHHAKDRVNSTSESSKKSEQEATD